MMKKATRNMIGALVFFFLLTVPLLVCAEEEVLNASISAKEVWSWKERNFIERLDNGRYVIQFINTDSSAKIKEVFGLVDFELTQVTPTFEAEPVLQMYMYRQDETLYLFKDVDGEYIGGPIEIPPFMLEDEFDDEESKPADPSKSVPVPQKSPPPASKEKEVRGGTGEKAYS